MKLRNKKTGEVYTACSIWFDESIEGLEKTKWRTLKEFCADWEDYEWLKITLAEGRGLKRAQIGEILYDYDWNANPDSLCKKYNRGEIGLKR